MDTILNALTNFGIAGAMAACVVWFLHHIMTSLAPRMLNHVSDQLKLEREACDRRHRDLLELFSTRHQELLTYITRGLTEMDTMHKDVMDEFREQRHTIRTLAHAAGLKEVLGDWNDDNNKKGVSPG